MGRKPWETCWTIERDHWLMHLYDRGLSLQTIADRINEAFGTTFSRDAVKGRAERLGLSRSKPGDRTP